MKKIGLFAITFISLWLFISCDSAKLEPTDWYLLQEATCYNDGLEERVNENGEYETRVIPKKNHVFDFSYTEDATCYHDGFDVYNCRFCNEEKRERIPMKKHNYTSRVIVDATCYSSGILLYECSNCGDSYEEEIKCIEHDYVVMQEVDSICNSVGYVLYRCSMCNNEYTEYKPEVFHNYEIIDRVEPNCGVPGFIQYECSICHDQYGEEFGMPTMNHNYEIVGECNPECGGYCDAFYVCNVCGSGYTDIVYSAYDVHEFDEFDKCVRCNAGIFEFEYDQYAYISNIYAYDKEEITIPKYTDDGILINGVRNIDWSKYPNLKRINFNGMPFDFLSNYSNIDSLDSININYSLDEWKRFNFNYDYNNPLINNVKLYVNNQELSYLRIENDITGFNSFEGIVIDNVELIRNDYPLSFANAVIEYLYTTNISPFKNSIVKTICADYENLELSLLPNKTLECLQIGYNVKNITNNSYGINDPENEFKADADFLFEEQLYSLNKSCMMLEKNNLYFRGILVEDIVVPENITYIGDEAFYNVRSIKTVTIHENVTYLGNQSFKCPNLEVLNYNAINSDSSGYVFVSENIKTVNLGAKVEKIVAMFENATIEEITLGENVRETYGLHKVYINNVYVDSKYIDTYNLLGNFYYKKAIINENISIIENSNLIRYKPDNYEDEINDDYYEIVILNENAKLATNYMVYTSTMISLTAPVDILNLLGDVNYYKNITATGSGNLYLRGLVTDTLNIVGDVFSLEIQNSYWINTDYRYVINLKNGTKFNNKFKFCSMINFNDLDALFNSDFSIVTLSDMNLDVVVNNKKAVDIVVPDNINHIPENMFKNTDIKSIDLNNVTSIGTNAFNECSYLESVIGNNVVEVDRFAFYRCSNLKNLNLLKLENIAESAFAESGIENFYFSPYLKTIGMKAFENSKIREFYPHSDIDIADYAFMNTSNLSSVDFNVFGGKLGFEVFADSNVEYLYISDNLDYHTASFSRMYFVKEYNLDKYSYDTINTTVYSKVIIRGGDITEPIMNNFIKELIIKNGVTSIEQYTIASNGVIKVTIEDGVTNINPDCISSNLFKLVEVVNLTNYGINNREGVSFINDVNDSKIINDNGYIIYGDGDIKYIVDYVYNSTCLDFNHISNESLYIIRKNFNKINHNEYIGFTDIVLSDNIVEIEKNTFANANLSELYIPSSVRNISSEAFYNNPYVSLLVDPLSEYYYSLDNNIIEKDTKKLIVGINGIVPTDILEIGDYAFYGSNIEYLFIESNITSIGHSIIDKCTNIKEVYLNSLALVQSDYVGYINIKQGDVLVTIGKDVAWIPTRVFNGSDGIKEVIIQCSNLSSGRFAFEGCNNLEKVTFENEFNWIPDGMFSQCTNLKEVVNTYPFEIIGNNAFYNCYSLESVDFINNTDTIYLEAFYNAGSSEISNLDLTSINRIGKNAFYGFSNSSIDTVIIDSIVEKGFDYTYNAKFYKAISNLNEVFGKNTIINNVVYTGETLTDGLFANSENIYSIDIVNAVTVGDYVFKNCINLTEIHLPKTVSSLGKYIFSGCSNLEKITLPFIGSLNYTNVNPIDMLCGEYFKEVESNANKEEGFIKIHQYYENLLESKKFYQIPISLKEITVLGGRLGYGTFMNFSLVENISIEGTDLDEIKTYSFENCTSLKELYLSPVYEKISGGAFEHCESLTSYNLPNSVSVIEGNPFTYTYSLEKISVDINNEYYYSNNTDSIISKDTNTLMVGCMNTKMDSSVINLGSWAFTGCKNLETFYIGSNLNTIESSEAFFNCTSLASFIGSSSAYYNVDNQYLLERTYDGKILLIRASINAKTICSGVTSIASYAFENVVFDDSTITIIDSVKSFSGDSFISCSYSYVVIENYTDTWYRVFNGVEKVDISDPKTLSNMMHTNGLMGFTDKS